MGNWFADAVGSLAGDLQYVFGSGSELQSADVRAENKAAAYADYSPGGRIYNQILNTRGQKAADAAWKAVQANYAAEGDLNVLQEEQLAGQEGANQGLQAVEALPGQVAGGIFNFSGATLWGFIKSIPWWVWLLLIGAGFVYLVGPAVVLGRARKVAGKAIGA